MENYNFVRINDNNYNFTQALYKESLGLNFKISDIMRKYDTAIFGHKNIGYFAVDNDHQPAAFYGVFPIVLSVDSKDIIVAQSGDTMTAPAHRGKGLFVTLAQKTYQLAEEEGIQLVFGFPNENSYPGFQKKLNWQFYDSMYKFSILNSALPACEFSSKYSNFAPMYQKYCSYRLKKYSISLNEDNIKPFSVYNSVGFIKKDLNFFKYKLLNSDVSLIRINDYSMLIKSKVHLTVGDVGFFEKDMTAGFLNSLKKLARILGCRTTNIIINKKHWLYEYLVSYIEPTKSLPIGFYVINKNIPLNEISFSQADYDTF